MDYVFLHQSTEMKAVEHPLLLTLGNYLIGAVALFSGWAASSPLGLGLTAVNLPIILAFLIALVLFIQRARIHILSVDYFLMSYLAIFFLSALGSENSNIGFSLWRYWLISLLGYLAARAVIKKPGHVKMLAWFCVAGSILTWTNLEPNVSEWGDLGRLSTDYVDTNFAAYAVSGYLYIFVIYASSTLTSKKRKLLHLPIILFMVWVICTLGTRGAIISSFSMLVYWLIGQSVPTWISRFGVFLLVLVSVLIPTGLLDFALFFLDAASGDRATGDLAGRTIIWQNAKEIIQANWLLGIGPGQFVNISDKGVGAHNFFLTVTLDSGILGLTLMLGFLTSLGILTSRTYIGITRINLGFLFVIYWAPIALSGHWELVQFSWIVIALTVQTARHSTALKGTYALHK